MVVLVHVFLRVDTALGGGALHLLSVFVGTGQEERLVAENLVEAGEDVREDGRVGVPDMRGVVNVIDRGSDVKIFHARKFRKNRHFCLGMVLLG